MKKLICFVLVITMLLSLPSFSYAEEKAEILYEASFEDGFSDWKYREKKYAPEYATVSEKGATDGVKSVRLYDISDSYSIGVDGPFIEVTPKETYSVSVDIFLVSGTAKLFFKFYDKDKKAISSKSIQGITGQWKNVVVTDVAPSKAVTCQAILCTDNGTYGEAYYDNVKIAKGTLNPYEITDGKSPLDQDLKEDDSKNEAAVLMFSDDFEEGYEKNWVYYNKNSDGFVKMTDEGYEESKAVMITDPSDSTTAGLKSIFFPAEEGQKYTVVCYMRNTEGFSTKLYFKYFDKDKKQIEAKSYGTNQSTWQIVQGSSTAPSGTAFCHIQLVGSIANAGTTIVDSVSLYNGLIKVRTLNKKYIPPVQKEAVTSKIVEPVNGKLKYNTYNDKGDTIGDFSYAGFYGGDYELPVTENLPVVATLSPSGTGDDTGMLQAAIDKAERKDGGINVIKLKEGRYFVNDAGIRLKSGVVLSGEGQGPEGTIIYGYQPKQYKVIKIMGSNYSELLTSGKITDDYVKSGSRTINIDPEMAPFFKPGDEIVIVHNSTEKWAEALDMVGTINVYDDITTWTPGDVNMLAERTVVKTNGTEITLDFPVFVPYMKDLVPSYVAKIRDNSRVENAGVENLRVESYYNGDKDDEAHATSAISIGYAKNIFVRDITAKYFYYSLVTCGRGAKQVTVRNCSSLEPVSRVEGARRYAYCVSTGAQQILCTGSYSYDSRHDYATSGQANGPVAYVDNVVEMSNTSSEAHGTWTNGLLYDNIYHIGNASRSFSALANRGIYGTVRSQGWTAAGSVMWNILSSTILVHTLPANYQNFAVGIWGLYTDSDAVTMKNKHITSFKKVYRTGKIMEGSDENFVTDENTSIVGDSYKEALYTPVEPRSLFKAQLADRYTGNIANERPNAPILINPFPDSLTEGNHVTVDGICQLGAEKVTVYIDNIPYDAKINEDNTFGVTVDLSDGTHKVYATQTIKGFESCKTSDRFTTLNEYKGNADYLKSIYSPDKVRMLLNDPRSTYDEIIKGIKVKINDRLLYSDVAPTEISGRVLVPMRAIFEKFNADIVWDEKTKTATAKAEETEVKITENSNKAYINGKEVILDVPATIINGRFVVPVRFVSEAFGADVAWEDETRTVFIKK